MRLSARWPNGDQLGKRSGPGHLLERAKGPLAFVETKSYAFGRNKTKAIEEDSLGRLSIIVNVSGKRNIASSMLTRNISDCIYIKVFFRKYDRTLL